MASRKFFKQYTATTKPKLLRSRKYFIVLPGLVFLLFSAQSCGRKMCVEGTVLEKTLRRHAIKKVLPQFPQNALTSSTTGVAVAKIIISENGNVKSVEILEAPHPLLAQATVAALQQWVFDFNSSEEENPVCFSGKLTFYFSIIDGKPVVRDPSVFN